METLVEDRAMQQIELDTQIAEREDIDTDLDVAWEELQSRKLELVRIKEDEKAHRAEIDALRASAEKTRRHLADLDAKAVEEEKKEKRRRTYLLRLEKKEAAIAAQENELALKEATTLEAEVAVAEKARELWVKMGDGA